MTFNGSIQAETISLAKFGISGRLTAINYHIGNTVKKGQLLATLEATELQAYLDRSLKQYDLQRTEFDEKQKQSLIEYEKRKLQDELDVTVKNVEIAKCNLNATQLVASITGIIVDMDLATVGDNITPGGFVMTIVDPGSFYFEALLPEENLTQVNLNQSIKVFLKAFPDQTFTGQIYQISPMLDKKNFSPLKIKLPAIDNLKLGLTGSAEI